MDADWKRLSKQRAAYKPTADQEQQQLQLLLKQTLQRLQQERRKPAPLLLPDLDPNKTTEPKAGDTKSKNDGSSEPKNEAPLPENSVPGKIDPLYLGNALVRLERYEEALASFRLVELKGKKAEERAPVQFLMASCLLHLGKNDEAIELLREAANSRGDERTAGYAQWQLEMQRWQREINDRLNGLRKRRLATEKQP